MKKRNLFKEMKAGVAEMAAHRERKGAQHNPAHPGEILKGLYLQPLGVTLAEAAAALEVSRRRLSSVVNGKAAITPDMALRLSAVLGTEPDIWVNLQAQYDLWLLRNQKPIKLQPLRLMKLRLST